MSIAQVSSDDGKFAGAVPQLYQRYLVPLLFEPYAVDLARQVAALRPDAVLELAAGTGAVTRELVRQLAPCVPIVATDLNQPMLDEAARIGTSRPVEWRQADALQLPFPEQAFDIVACQFGVMFFPDKVKAFAEAKRVLRPGGCLVFNTWDSVENNDMIHTVCDALDALFPDDPPCFVRRGPHGYADTDVIARDLAAAGFTDTVLSPVAHPSRAPSAREPALGYCHGTPLRAELEARGPEALATATDAAVAALERRFGTGPVEGQTRAYIVVARA